MLYILLTIPMSLVKGLHPCTGYGLKVAQEVKLRLPSNSNDNVFHETLQSLVKLQNCMAIFIW